MRCGWHAAFRRDQKREMSTSEYPARRLGGPSLRDLAGALPADVWLVVVLVVVASVIRILVINDQSYWQDEALTAYEAGLPFGAMIHTVLHFETTPPLYFVAIWIWGHLFGTGEIALRSFSTLAGIALVPIAYLAARELASRRAGVIAAALVAVNPFMIWYSQEARSYMLVAALSGAAFLWFIRARRDPSRRNLTWWGVLASLSLMAHFFAGFAVAAEALWLLWRWRTRAVALVVGVVAVVEVAMAPIAYADASHGAGWIATTPLTARLGKTVNEWAVSMMLRRATTAENLLGGVALIVAVVLLLVIAGDRRGWDTAKVGAGIATFVFLVPLALALLGHDYFYSRYVIPAFIPVVTVLAAACALPRARVLGGALALGLLTLFSVAAIVVQTNRTLQRPDWRSVAHALGDSSAPRAILAAAGTAADALKIYLPGAKWVYPPARGTVVNEIDVVGTIRRLVLLAPERPGASVAFRTAPVKGLPVPATSAPPGARLLTRFRVDNWIVARFVMKHPVRVSIDRLVELSPRFFAHAPRALLAFFQQPLPKPR
jgi:mannosyltransferase